ncbi:hypothetical protein A6R68_02028 [Neotoma lepida]|uniref:Uncharacterized protein n=1 Tax=Neotoma lepida TaxID=56216 RepID=A0A1A6GUV2_NEOLE|nr:hypothetical protein A6R68_02028 [Neotoma lepida]
MGCDCQAERRLTLPEGEKDDRLDHEELEDRAVGTEQLPCGEVEEEECVVLEALSSPQGSRIPYIEHVSQSILQPKTQDCQLHQGHGLWLLPVQTSNQMDASVHS